MQQSTTTVGCCAGSPQSCCVLTSQQQQQQQQLLSRSPTSPHIPRRSHLKANTIEYNPVRQIGNHRPRACPTQHHVIQAKSNHAVPQPTTVYETVAYGIHTGVAEDHAHAHAIVLYRVHCAWVECYLHTRYSCGIQEPATNLPPRASAQRQ